MSAPASAVGPAGEMETGPGPANETRPKGSAPWIARARIASGLVLFVYVAFHFANHALGLWSHEAMAAMGAVMKTVWRATPMTVLLYGALAVHVVVALWPLVARRTLRMGWGEWLQVALGIAIPFLMVIHVTATRLAAERHGLNDTYAYVLVSTFVFSHSSGWLNAVGLVAAWLHGCIGIERWLAFKRVWTPGRRRAALVVATLWPTLALTGYLAAGRELAPKMADGEWAGAYYERLGVTDDAVFAAIDADISIARAALVAGLIVLLGAMATARIVRARGRRVRVDYVDGPVVSHPGGATLLDVSRANGVPHAAACGGRARCSTCRVRVLACAGRLAEPDALEERLLSRVGAGADVRLACRARVDHDMRVLRLLPPDAGMADALRQRGWESGTERTVAIMFADLRDFTATAERRLPFDVVYLVNGFARSMGEAVEAHGGRIDKFLGDGFMAIFGLTTTPETAARAALAATAEAQARLDALNHSLTQDLDRPLRMGVGLHAGPVVLGAMGHGTARGLTAIGDAVNIASRLEQATKEHGALLCVSQETLRLAGVGAPDALRRVVSIRGRQGQMEIAALSAPDVARLIPSKAGPDARDATGPARPKPETVP